MLTVANKLKIWSRAKTGLGRLKLAAKKLVPMPKMVCVCMLASSPDHSQILSCKIQLQDKTWERSGNEAMHMLCSQVMQKLLVPAADDINKV